MWTIYKIIWTRNNAFIMSCKVTSIFRSEDIKIKTFNYFTIRKLCETSILKNEDIIIRNIFLLCSQSKKLCKSKSLIDRVIKIQYKMKKNKRVRFHRRNGDWIKFRVLRRIVEVESCNKVNWSKENEW